MNKTSIYLSAALVITFAPALFGAERPALNSANIPLTSTFLPGSTQFKHDQSTTINLQPQPIGETAKDCIRMGAMSGLQQGSSQVISNFMTAVVFSGGVYLVKKYVLGSAESSKEYTALLMQKVQSEIDKNEAEEMQARVTAQTKLQESLSLTSSLITQRLQKIQELLNGAKDTTDKVRFAKLKELCIEQLEDNARKTKQIAALSAAASNKTEAPTSAQQAPAKLVAEAA